MDHDFEMLEKRMKRLESQNRLLKRLATLLVAIAMVGATRAQIGGNTVISSQKFELRDDAGHLRAELEMLNGMPALRFLDQDGDVQALLAGDSFTIYNKGGDGLTAFAKDGLQFEDAKANTFAAITAYPEDHMGKIFLRDWRSGVYVTITPADLNKLRKLKLP